MDAEKLTEVCEGDENVKRYLLGNTWKCRIADRFESYAKVCDRTFRTQFMRWDKPGKEGRPDKMFFTLDGVEEPNPPVDV